MGRKDLSAKRKEQIVEAFIICATREGLKNATNRKIAEEAGIQHSIIHHYFKDRTEMLEALMEKVASIIVTKFFDSFSGSKSKEEQVDVFTEYLFGTIFDDTAGSLIYDLWSEAKRNETIRKCFDTMYEKYRTIGAIQLEASGYGVLFSYEEKRTFSTIFAGIQEGVLIQWDMGKDKVNVEAVRKMVRDMILSYFQRKEEELSE